MFKDNAAAFHALCFHHWLQKDPNILGLGSVMLAILKLPNHEPACVSVAAGRT